MPQPLGAVQSGGCTGARLLAVGMFVLAVGVWLLRSQGCCACECYAVRGVCEACSTVPSSQGGARGARRSAEQSIRQRGVLGS